MTVTCPDCGDEIPSEHGLKIHRGKRHAAAGGGTARAPAGTPAPARPQLVATDDDLDPDSPFAPPPVSDAETPPKEAPPWRERLWGAGAETKKPKRPAPSRERRPRRRRVSTEAIWATAWTGAGLALVRSGADIPVGNCLQFQAPVVGPILDDAIAGTWVDRLLQPIAGSGERLKKVGTVVGMPVLVFGIQRAPAEMVPMLETMLREMIRENLVEMARVAKARQKQDEQYRKALTDLGMEPGPAGRDPVDDVIDAILGGRPPAGPDPTVNGAGEPQPTYATAG